MLHRITLGLLAMIGIITAANPLYASYHLTCQDEIGREVCVSIRRVESLSNPCTGSGCDFSALTRRLDKTTALYLDALATSASEQAGEYARSATDALCGTRFTGPTAVISRLRVSLNRFMVAMDELQELAEIEDPVTCEFGH